MGGDKTNSRLQVYVNTHTKWYVPLDLTLISLVLRERLSQAVD
jgi:hypothetical protein